MPKKQMIDKNGNTWEWEETPEVVKAVKKLHESSAAVKRKVEVDNITWTDVFDKLEYDRLNKTFTVISPKVKSEEILNESDNFMLHQRCNEYYCM